MYRSSMYMMHTCYIAPQMSGIMLTGSMPFSHSGCHAHMMNAMLIAREPVVRSQNLKRFVTGASHDLMLRQPGALPHTCQRWISPNLVRAICAPQDPSTLADRWQHGCNHGLTQGSIRIAARAALVEVATHANAFALSAQADQIGRSTHPHLYTTGSPFFSSFWHSDLIYDACTAMPSSAGSAASLPPWKLWRTSACGLGSAKDFLSGSAEASATDPASQASYIRYSSSKGQSHIHAIPYA